MSIIKRCIECQHMKVVEIEDGCGSSAKCFLTSKKGKSITWAMTTLGGDGKCTSGDKRVMYELKKQNLAPSWCPIRRGQST